MPKPDYQPGDLLTKMECMELFCSVMRIGRNAYYDNYRPFIKFKYYGSKIDEDGNEKKTIPRIPYEIALGLINLLLERPQADDPPLEKLTEFMKNVPEGVEA